MNSTQVQKLIDEHNVIVLRADFTRGDPQIKQLLAQLGNPAGSLPYYAVFPARDPQRPIVFDGVITASQVVQVLRQAGPSQIPSGPGAAASATSKASQQSTGGG